MTTATCHLILGRPLVGWADSDEDRILKHYGVDAIEGLDCLYQGHSYVGIEIGGIWSQTEIKSLTDVDMSWTPEQEVEARRICDAMPEAVKLDPDCLPFGAYLVGSDG